MPFWRDAVLPGLDRSSVVWLACGALLSPSGSLCFPARLRGAFEAPLRLAEGARPRRECSPARPALATMELEATSDNYTEVPSDLQLDLVRADEHDRRARPGGRRLPGQFRAVRSEEHTSEL